MTADRAREIRVSTDRLVANQAQFWRDTFKREPSPEAVRQWEDAALAGYLRGMMGMALAIEQAAANIDMALERDVAA